jgi:hypothetical protein
MKTDKELIKEILACGTEENRVRFPLEEDLSNKSKESVNDPQ